MSSDPHYILNCLAELSSGEESDFEGLFSDDVEKLTPSLSPTLPPFEQCSPAFNSSNPPSRFAALSSDHERPARRPLRLRDSASPPRHFRGSSFLGSGAILGSGTPPQGYGTTLVDLGYGTPPPPGSGTTSTLLLNQVHLRPLPNNDYKPSNYYVVYFL